MKRGKMVNILNEVFVLVRGTLVEHGDPFLSPIIPTVEDKC